MINYSRWCGGVVSNGPRVDWIAIVDGDAVEDRRRSPWSSFSPSAAEEPRYVSLVSDRETFQMPGRIDEHVDRIVYRCGCACEHEIPPAASRGWSRVIVDHTVSAISSDRVRISGTKPSRAPFSIRVIIHVTCFED